MSNLCRLTWTADENGSAGVPRSGRQHNPEQIAVGLAALESLAVKGVHECGSTGEVQQTLSIHGSRGGNMRRMVDGLSMQSQGASVSAFAANSGMIQEVTVDTAAGSAEQSAGGVRMNIIPREGGNTFTGSLS